MTAAFHHEKKQRILATWRSGCGIVGGEMCRLGRSKLRFMFGGVRQGQWCSLVSISLGEKTHMFVSVAPTLMGWNMTSGDHNRSANVRIHVINVSCPAAAH